MIIPSTVTEDRLYEMTEAELVEAYLEDGLSREGAEATAAMLLHPPPGIWVD